MKDINEFLSNISEPAHRDRVKELFGWTEKTFPQLKVVIKWNQPMFTDHDTFIISYSASKKHLSIAPKQLLLQHSKRTLQILAINTRTILSKSLGIKRSTIHYYKS